MNHFSAVSSSILRLTCHSTFNQLPLSLPPILPNPIHLTFGLQSTNRINYPTSHPHVWKLFEPVGRISPFHRNPPHLWIFFRSTSRCSPLSHLSLRSCINQRPSVTYLLFGCLFNGLVIHLPPRSSGLSFHQLVAALPSTLTHFTFKNYFAFPLGTLPSSLKI